MAIALDNFIENGWGIQTTFRIGSDQRDVAADLQISTDKNLASKAAGKVMNSAAYEEKNPTEYPCTANFTGTSEVARQSLLVGDYKLTSSPILSKIVIGKPFIVNTVSQQPDFENVYISVLERLDDNWIKATVLSKQAYKNIFIKQDIPLRINVNASDSLVNFKSSELSDNLNIKTVNLVGGTCSSCCSSKHTGTCSSACSQCSVYGFSTSASMTQSPQYNGKGVISNISPISYFDVVRSLYGTLTCTLAKINIGSDIAILQGYLDIESHSFDNNLKTSSMLNAKTGVIGASHIKDNETLSLIIFIGETVTEVVRLPQTSQQFLDEFQFDIPVSTFADALTDSEREFTAPAVNGNTHIYTSSSSENTLLLNFRSYEQETLGSASVFDENGQMIITSHINDIYNKNTYGVEGFDYSSYQNSYPNSVEWTPIYDASNNLTGANIKVGKIVGI